MVRRRDVPLQPIFPVIVVDGRAIAQHGNGDSGHNFGGIDIGPSSLELGLKVISGIRDKKSKTIDVCGMCLRKD